MRLTRTTFLATTLAFILGLMAAILAPTLTSSAPVPKPPAPVRFGGIRAQFSPGVAGAAAVASNAAFFAARDGLAPGAFDPQSTKGQTFWEEAASNFIGPFGPNASYGATWWCLPGGAYLVREGVSWGVWQPSTRVGLTGHLIASGILSAPKAVSCPSGNTYPATHSPAS